MGAQEHPRNTGHPSTLDDSPAKKVRLNQPKHWANQNGRDKCDGVDGDAAGRPDEPRATHKRLVKRANSEGFL